MYSVYALGDPRTQQIHYIGISENVYRRYADHLNHPHINDTKNAWMSGIKQAGIVPTLAILESDIDRRSIYKREKYWIAHFLTIGAPLTNIMHGNLERAIKQANKEESISILAERWRQMEMEKTGMYRVFEVKGKGGFQVFWCPSAPTHYNDKVPYSDHVYTQRQGAYRKLKSLREKPVPKAP